MIRPDDDPLTWVMLLDQLSEAHTHLGELIAEIDRVSQIDDADVMVQLGHVYGHLNRFWHGRKIANGNMDQLYTDENSSFPGDVIIT